MGRKQGEVRASGISRGDQEKLMWNFQALGVRPSNF